MTVKRSIKATLCVACSGVFLFGSALVPLFAKNVVLSETKDLYENTEIFELCKKMLKV